MPDAALPLTAAACRPVSSRRRAMTVGLALAALAALTPALGSAAAQAAPGAIPATPAAARPAAALPADAVPVDGALCRYHTDLQSRQAQLPPHLLTAISHVESGRWDPARGEKVAWPWTINALGQGKFFPTKQAAIAEVRRLLAAGVRSIDVGCMQINLRYHPDAFPDLETAFDPAANVAYAIQFLSDLKAASGSWSTAAARYHSATPERGAGYRAKVVAEQARLQGRPMRQEDMTRVAALPPALRGPGRAQGLFHTASPALSARLAAANAAAAAERQAKLAAARAERERERAEAKQFADSWRNRRLAAFLAARTGVPAPHSDTGAEAIETAAIPTAAIPTGAARPAPVNAILGISAPGAIAALPPPRPAAAAGAGAGAAAGAAAGASPGALVSRPAALADAR